MSKRVIYISGGKAVEKFDKPFTHSGKPYSHFGNLSDRLGLFSSDYDRYNIGIEIFNTMSELLQADIYIITLHSAFPPSQLSLPKDSLKILDCSESIAFEFDDLYLDEIDFIFAYRQPDLDYFNLVCPEKIIHDMPHLENVSYYEQFYKKLEEKEDRITLWSKYRNSGINSDVLALLFANKYTELPIHLFTHFDEEYMSYYFNSININAQVHPLTSLDKHTEFLSESKYTMSYRTNYKEIQWGHTIVPSAIVGTPSIGTSNVYAQVQLFPDLVIDDSDELPGVIEFALSNYDDIIGYAKERAYNLFSIDKQKERLNHVI